MDYLDHVLNMQQKKNLGQAHTHPAPPCSLHLSSFLTAIPSATSHYLFSTMKSAVMAIACAAGAQAFVAPRCVIVKEKA